MMINTILFDLDGLLIDSESMFYHLYLDLLKQYDQEFTLEEYAQNYSGKTAVTNMTNLIQSYHLPINLEEGLSFIDQREKYYLDQGIPLKTGTKELLKYLKENNYKIILATSSKPLRAKTILKQNHVEDYFDDYVFGSELKHSKPFPDVFNIASQKANSKKEECLVLEDSEAGIEASYRANIKVICIPDIKQPAKEYQEKTYQMMDSLLDVIELLKTQS